MNSTVYCTCRASSHTIRNLVGNCLFSESNSKHEKDELTTEKHAGKINAKRELQ